MTSFLETNKYYLKELKSSVRGLTLSDRSRSYQEKFQSETRSRLRNFYLNVPDIRAKILFYEEALENLMEFEFQYLLLSIYFEKDVDLLFSGLRTSINRNVPMSYKDDYGLLRFTTLKQVNPPSLRQFLSDTVNDLMGIRSLPFTNTDNTSPEIYQFSEWLLKAISSESDVRKILMGLMHYVRYWSEAYSESDRYISKGIILLDKINQAYSSIDVGLLKVDLRPIVLRVRRDCFGLLPLTCASPFTDDASSVQHRQNTKWYLARLNEFNLLLERNSIFFENLSDTKLSDMFAIEKGLNSKLRPHFEEVVRRAFFNGKVLSKEDYSFLTSVRNSDEYQTGGVLREFCDMIIRINYLYELR